MAEEASLRSHDDVQQSRTKVNVAAMIRRSQQAYTESETAMAPSPSTDSIDVPRELILKLKARERRYGLVFGLAAIAISTIALFGFARDAIGQGRSNWLMPIFLIGGPIFVLTAAGIGRGIARWTRKQETEQAYNEICKVAVIAHSRTESLPDYRLEIAWHRRSYAAENEGQEREVLVAACR